MARKSKTLLGLFWKAGKVIDKMAEANYPKNEKADKETIEEIKEFNPTLKAKKFMYYKLPELLTWANDSNINVVSVILSGKDYIVFYYD